MDPHRAFAFAPQVVLEVFEEEAVLVDLGSEKIFALNRTGAAVARGLERRLPVGELIAELEAEFAGEPGQIEREVLELLAELGARELIVPVGDGGPG